MWLLGAFYLVALALHGLGWGLALGDWFGTFVRGGLGLLTVWAIAAVCWLAAYRVGFRRTEVLLAAAAVTSYAAGNTFYVLMTVDGRSLPFPSLADIGYLLVSPLLLAAVAVTVSHHARGLTPWVWLDCAVGSLGAGAVLAVVLGPVLGSAAAGVSPLVTAAAVTVPMFGLVLVAAIAGIAAMQGVQMGSRWALLASGLLVFAAADVVYGLEVTAGTYVHGAPLDAGWAIGLALVAMWVDAAATDELTVTQGGLTATQGGLAEVRVWRRPATRATALAVSSAATIAGLGVLVLGSQVPVSTLALGLAAGALIAAGIRAQVAARLLERMASQRLVAAATDELTGLPNRRALFAEGYLRLAEPGCRRQALLMLDLDRFKEVNDRLGHRAGDELLVKVGARLQENLRGDDTLARLSGDEFAILLDDAGPDEAVDAAARLRAAVGQPLIVEDTSLLVGVSIGIAVFPDDGPDLSVLLRKADIAMNKAKTSRQGHHVYCTADDVDAAANLKTVRELRTALNRDQFVLHYQPKVDLDTGEVNSVEALVRWDHPTGGLLGPDGFVNLIEESGLMPALTRSVLAQALDQAAAWHREGHPLTVAVNISASSLVDTDLPNQVASMLAARGVPPSSLQLEITEGFLMVNRDLARVILTSLRNNGVSISVDDFGTGYSSLSYLRDMPIDEIKIDNSFVIPMTHDPRAAVLVSATIELAHRLGLRIVAEGVETAAAYTELTRMGCDQAQGYFLSTPLPAAELNRWLNRWRARDRSAAIRQILPTTA